MKSGFFFFLFFFGATYGGQIHAVMAFDTMAFDIAREIDANARIVESQIRQIAKKVEMPLHFISLKGSKATPENIVDTLKELKADPDDMIIFFFCGHGYRTSFKSAPWPNLFLTIAYKGLDLQKLADILLEKDARLTIVMAECCNSLIPDKTAYPLYLSLSPLKNRTLHSRGIQVLFLQHGGFYVATSSKPGQVSYISMKGGIYLNAWLDALYRKSKHPHPSWEQVFEQASLSTMEETLANPRCELQEPYFEKIR